MLLYWLITAMNDEISVHWLEESEITFRDQMRRNSLLSSPGQQPEGKSQDTLTLQWDPEILPLGFALRAPITNTPEGLLRRWALQGWGSWGLWRASLAWCWGRETAVLCHPTPLGATVWKSPHSPQAHQIYAALDRPPNPLLQLPWNAETVTAVIHFKIRKSFKPRWSYQ